VLATVPGYPAAVQAWNRTRWFGPGCHSENRGTQQVRGQVRTELQFNFTVPTTLAPIKYLNSHRIATWSIREMCRLMPCFINHSQIRDLINIRWLTSKLSWISCQNDHISKNWNGILSILSILKFKFAFSQLCDVLWLEMYSVKLFSYLCRIFKLRIVFPKGYSLVCYIVL